jgi:hypothetical protein
MPLAIKPGARFGSAVCDLEVIVVKGTSDALDLRAGGQEMVPVGTDKPGGTPAPGFDQGTVLGKRYTDAAGEIELLCTKAGPSSLSIGDELLDIKEAKPLPSSD